VIELMLVFFPFAFCCGWFVERTTRILVIVLVTAAAVAVPVEVAQGWIVERYPDVTDVACVLAGAAAGVLAGARARRVIPRVELVGSLPPDVKRLS
jgi:glycopeptide antibiotics resistance protein